jgi:hypothetical protein
MYRTGCVVELPMNEVIRTLPEIPESHKNTNLELYFSNGELNILKVTFLVEEFGSK